MIRNSINAVWDRWANLHPSLRFLIVLLVVGALGMFALKPAYRLFKSWRLDRNLVAARKAVQETRMDDARDLSLTVLRAGDPRIEAFRILEKSTASLRDPRHGDIARALITHPDSSDDDRWQGFIGIAGETPLGLAGQAWTSLSAELRHQPRFATAFADRLISEKRFSEAASVLLDVPEKERGSEVQRRLIRVLIGAGKKQGYDEAQRLIANGFPNDDAAIPQWLDLLEEIPAMSLQPAVLSPIRKALETPKRADNPRMALMVARLDYAADFSGRAGVLEKTIARWKDRDPVMLAKFLRDLGVHQLLLETFPAERVSQEPALFPHVLEAMEQTAAWELAVKLLDSHGGQLPKFEELAQRAIIAGKSGDPPTLVRHWSAAMDEAKSIAAGTAYLTLHRLARAAGLNEQADQAMVEAIRMGRGPLPLYAEIKPLLNSLARQAKENVLLEICATYLSFEPGNPVLLTQYAYLAFFNNLADAKTVLKAMEPLAKGFPKETPIQCLVATAYLSDGQAAKAAEILDRLALDPDKLPPAYRAVHIATQVLNRRMPKNDPRVTGFPWKSLQPSERKKFGELIQSAQP